jgi:hypothetical protein
VSWYTLVGLLIFIGLCVPDVSKFVTDDMQTFWCQQIADTGVSLERRQQALRTWFWVSRFYVQFYSNEDLRRLSDLKGSPCPGPSGF